VEDTNEKHLRDERIKIKERVNISLARLLMEIFVSSKQVSLGGRLSLIYSNYLKISERLTLFRWKQLIRRYIEIAWLHEGLTGQL